MKLILIITLIVCMQISVLIHIQNMLAYILTKSMKYFKGFMITAISNTVIGLFTAVIVMVEKEVLKKINVDIMLIIESGIIFFYMIYIKGMITVRIIKRSRDPEYYHLSFLGKKVYDKKVVDPKELMAFFITLPFTLIAGAYFVVKLAGL